MSNAGKRPQQVFLDWLSKRTILRPCDKRVMKNTRPTFLSVHQLAVTGNLFFLHFSSVQREQLRTEQVSLRPSPPISTRRRKYLLYMSSSSVLYCAQSFKIKEGNRAFQPVKSALQKGVDRAKQSFLHSFQLLYYKAEGYLNNWAKLCSTVLLNPFLPYE